MVTAEMKRRVLSECRAALVPDPHGDQGVYRVTSQYYDTPDLRAYWEKLDGVDPRRKFRLRFYGDSGPYFLEIKHRNNQSVSKERMTLQEEAALEMLTSDQPLEELTRRLPESEDTEELLSELEAASWRDVLQPTAVITYQREAWVEVLDQRLRLTFDHFCAALSPGGYRTALEGGGVLMRPATAIVMELKFTRALPVWLRELTMELGLLPERFSKYAFGLEALGARLTAPSRASG